MDCGCRGVGDNPDHGRCAPAFSADALSFPPTSFMILNRDTGIAIGRSRYRIESTREGATLRGENTYYDDQSDVETAELQPGAGGEPPRLVEFDHTFFNADGSIQRRAHLDLKSGAATCIDNSGAQKSEQAELLSIPDNTWAGASIAIPIQDLLRARDKRLARPIHVFNCAPGPKIFAISVKIDPAKAVWAALRRRGNPSRSAAGFWMVEHNRRGFGAQDSRMVRSERRIHVRRRRSHALLQGPADHAREDGWQCAGRRAPDK